MRLGGPIFTTVTQPDEWIASLRQHGYHAAYAPVDQQASATTVAAFRQAAAQHDVVIAEVGAWSNPLAVDVTQRATAITFCQERLALADALGARCCVNIAGSRGAEWDGPDAANYHPDTFALIVDTVRTIIDAVKPKDTYYTLETMPWMYPDSPEVYQELIRAIDRPQFAVHFDPVNLINSVPRFFQHREFIRHCVDLLGPFIKSCHIKDMRIERPFVVALPECAPGLGMLDYVSILRTLAPLGDVPLMLEHLQEAQQYAAAAAYVRAAAQQAGIPLQ
ncbi:MAG: sugar phosphate isomerase/epimerase family protein [Roseiflexaceae bacterium]